MIQRYLLQIITGTAIVLLMGCEYSDDGSIFDITSVQNTTTQNAPDASMAQDDEALVIALANNFSNIDPFSADVNPGTNTNNNFVPANTTVNKPYTIAEAKPLYPLNTISDANQTRPGNTVVQAPLVPSPTDSTTKPVTQATGSNIPVTDAPSSIVAAAPDVSDTSTPAAETAGNPVTVTDSTTSKPTTNSIVNKDPVLTSRPLIMPRGNQNSALGTNISSIRDWATGQPFVNVMKSARAFRQNSPASIIYDSNGWPTDLKGNIATTYLLTGLMDGAIPYGRYTVLYDGKGTIEYKGGIVRLIESNNGKDIIEISSGNGNLSLNIKQTDAADYIRNIRVLMPGGICESDPLHHASRASDCQKGDYLDYVTHHNEILFNPDFLRNLYSFKVLRFMDFMDTNNSQVSKWSDLTKFSTATWGSTGDKISGAPIEVMVELANRLNADPWFCMPHLANDDYVAKFADYVRDNLKPGLKAYIEYSNEVWNGMFKQSDYAAERGMALKLDTKSYNAGMKFHSRRSVEVFKIWEQRFNGTDRIVRVMGSHAGNPWLSDTILLPYEDAYKHTDALAIAPYFGGDPVPLRSLNDLNSIFTKLKDTGYAQSLPRRLEKVHEIVKVAKKYDVDLVAYEGGQHLVDWTTSKDDQHPNPLFYQANRSPQMGELYKEYLLGWKNSGGKLFVNFTSPTRWSKYGSWGLKEHLNQSDSDTPKHRAVMEFINDHPKWW